MAQAAFIWGAQPRGGIGARGLTNTTVITKPWRFSPELNSLRANIPREAPERYTVFYDLLSQSYSTIFIMLN
jgi:hypothetical protein